MDSMRSLNTSLPRARPSRAAAQQDLQQSFRTAALTVTNLYRSALADSEKARDEGYQEALEDLIRFLDKENLGVGDGEGWRIRQWAMERVDGALPGNVNSDDDEETLEEKRARSSSPILDRNSSPEETRSSEPPHADSATRGDSAPPPAHAGESTAETEMLPPQTFFQFTSPHAYPANYTDPVAQDFHAAARRAFPPRRTSTRPNQRNLQRSAASNILSLGNGAGQKRKVMEEFFNIDAFSDRRDRGGGGGGPKRGRMA